MDSTRTSSLRGGFTLVELIVVIVVLAILAGIAIPKYFDYSVNAKQSACQGTLGGVRSAVSNFYANAAVSGTTAFPTLVQIQTTGTVMQEAIAANPYNGSAVIAAATWTTSQAVSGTSGWNYDAATGHFWANSSTVGENAW